MVATCSIQVNWTPLQCSFTSLVYLLSVAWCSRGLFYVSDHDVSLPFTCQFSLYFLFVSIKILTILVEDVQ